MSLPLGTIVLFSGNGRRPRGGEGDVSEAGLAIEADDATARTDAGARLPRRSCPRFRVERIAGDAMTAHREAWADLCARPLEHNVFLDPGFALPLVQHGKAMRRFGFLIVWEADASLAAGRMLGLLPIRGPQLTAWGRSDGFADKLVCLGTPLLDADHGRAAFVAMLDWLAARFPRPIVLSLTSIPADGAFMRDVVASLASDRRVDILASYHRAVLRRDQAIDGKVLSLQSAKSRKERKRQRRRLAEQGERAYVSARSPDAMAAATESFLALEQKGWKGARRTALLDTPASAAFVREMTREMGLAGKCRIDALELSGRAVAMGIVLRSGSCAYFWKTAFDEGLAPLSPGVQFTMDLADAQLGEVGISLTDSCAVPDHSMIDRLWPDRAHIVDLAIALRPGSALSLSLGLALERARRRSQAWMKRVVRRARGFGVR